MSDFTNFRVRIEKIINKKYIEALKSYLIVKDTIDWRLALADSM